MPDTHSTRAPEALHPLRALRALLVVMRNPEDTATGALMVRHLTGSSQRRFFERFALDPSGAKILRDGRRLERTLADRDSLAALPSGSLGRRYFEWTRDEDISAEGLLNAIEPAFRDAPVLSPSEDLINIRGTVSHDLWHVVTGYGRDLLGESALLHMIRMQYGNTGLILPIWLAMLSPDIGSAGRRLMWDARRRAREAAWLPVQDWEALLPKPLAEVREQLCLGEPPQYTPVYATS